MAFEVRICARCGAEEFVKTIGQSGSEFTIHVAWFGGLPCEVCAECLSHINGMIRSEMRYDGVKPKPKSIERNEDDKNS